MSNHTTIYDRFEDKYIINKKQFLYLKNALSNYGTIDSYGLYPISSLYFDNSQNTIADTAQKNPLNNKKLRLRKYSHTPFKDNDSLLYEVKERKSGRVLKKRTAITLNNSFDLSYVQAEDISSFKLIDEFRNTYNLFPKLQVTYLREAYQFYNHPDLRVTFDSNIHATSFNIEKCKANSQYLYLIPCELYLLEIKYYSCMPNWLEKLLNMYHINQTTFSKFTYAYNYLNSDTSG